ncbi:pentapeptide repeat-containing protein [Foetidibacter luteolus]|uniref:pentapeptide repeat-containing protein n=1 Tax=Foetidibacter luteolus TaxID=2608880 RepID=UPI00129A9494|nr:pentapeptide repeat-containing protein [Foetidibacter luteolus]
MTIPQTLTPKFSGNATDLEEFKKLADSPMRSNDRETALHDWEAYKLKRQLQAYNLSTGSKKGAWTKGGYIRALTARAINLKSIYYSNLCIGYADFRGANFDDALFDAEDGRGWISMKGCRLQGASFRNAVLQNARMMETDCRGADFSGAKLQNADFSNANLQGANFFDADLSGSNLTNANLVNANLQGANICGCRVYGVSAWDITPPANAKLSRDLIVTPGDQPEVSVDSIEIAQLVYLFLNNAKIKSVIDTITKKGVLILGRFTAERKEVLDALRTELRNRGYLPMLFDFEKPAGRDLTETVSTLAHLAKFVIADITDAKSIPQELKAIVPALPSLPVQPIILDKQFEYSMFIDFAGFFSVLPPYRYKDTATLLAALQDSIIQPTINKATEIEERRKLFEQSMKS